MRCARIGHDSSSLQRWFDPCWSGGQGAYTAVFSDTFTLCCRAIWDIPAKVVGGTGVVPQRLLCSLPRHGRNPTNDGNLTQLRVEQIYTRSGWDLFAVRRLLQAASSPTCDAGPLKSLIRREASRALPKHSAGSMQGFCHCGHRLSSGQNICFVDTSDLDYHPAPPMGEVEYTKTLSRASACQCRHPAVFPPFGRLSPTCWMVT